MSLEKALEAAIAEVGGKVRPDEVVGLTQIEAPSPELSKHLTNELYNGLGAKVRLSISAGAIRRLRMVGLVPDSDAAEASCEQGTDIAILADFAEDPYLLYVRAVNTKNKERRATCQATICPDDNTLRKLPGGKIAAPEKPAAAEPVDKTAIERVEHGKDLYAEGKTDEAIAAFTQALDAAEALFYRGNAHYSKDEYEAAIADYTAALKNQAG